MYTIIEARGMNKLVSTCYKWLRKQLLGIKGYILETKKIYQKNNLRYLFLHILVSKIKKKRTNKTSRN